MLSYFSHVRKGIEQHKLGENKRVSRKVNRQTNKRTKKLFLFFSITGKKMVFAVCPYFDMFFAKVGLQLLNLSNSFLLSQSRKQQ